MSSRITGKMLLSAVLCTVIIGTTWSTDRYAPNNPNNGSPWYTTLNAAINASRSGDVIYLNGDCINEPSTITCNHGVTVTSSEYMVFRTVRIPGKLRIIRSNCNFQFIYFYGTSSTISATIEIHDTISNTTFDFCMLERSSKSNYLVRDSGSANLTFSMCELTKGDYAVWSRNTEGMNFPENSINTCNKGIRAEGTMNNISLGEVTLDVEGGSQGYCMKIWPSNAMTLTLVAVFAYANGGTCLVRNSNVTLNEMAYNCYP